jgi:hypothetical protein
MKLRRLGSWLRGMVLLTRPAFEAWAQLHLGVCVGTVRFDLIPPWRPQPSPEGTVVHFEPGPFVVTGGPA